jgi:hypothetical protein
MKKTLIMMAVAAIGLTSCQKDELAQPSNTANRPGNNFNVVDSLDYTLDFRCDTLNINVKYLHSYQYRHLLYSMAPNPMMHIGKVFYFKTQNGTNFTIWYNWDGRMSFDVSGNANGISFTDVTTASTNGTLNMCNYAQNAPYTFTLKNSEGVVVMTNVSNALSK